MGKTLLVRYVRMVLESARDARVPNQLIEPDTGSEDGKKRDEVEDVNEFSGVGAVAGYTAPLGANPDAMGRRKNAGKKRRK
jgi:hypothetical protein